MKLFNLFKKKASVSHKNKELACQNCEFKCNDVVSLEKHKNWKHSK